MTSEVDALVIGAGPAGASTAILLAQAGWRVVLVERQVYPRQKVCGECLTAGSLALLDKLGVGCAVRNKAGPELKRVGWMLTFASAVYNLVRIRNLIRSALVFKYSSRDRPRKTWCVQLV